MGQGLYKGFFFSEFPNFSDSYNDHFPMPVTAQLHT